MGKPLQTAIVEYAFEHASVVTPNIPVLIRTDVDGTITTEEKYRVAVTIVYEMLDESRASLGHREITHYSDLSDTKRSHADVTTWTFENRDAFILADKLELSGYAPN